MDFLDARKRPLRCGVPSPVPRSEWAFFWDPACIFYSPQFRAPPLGSQTQNLCDTCLASSLLHRTTQRTSSGLCRATRGHGRTQMSPLAHHLRHARRPSPVSTQEFRGRCAVTTLEGPQSSRAISKVWAGSPFRSAAATSPRSLRFPGSFLLNTHTRSTSVKRGRRVHLK